MSVLQGFAMLNDSIRQIRTDRAAHEQRMMGLQLEKEKMEAQLNDPRTRLAKMQASREMEMTPINFNIGKFDNDKDRKFFNRYTRPEIEGILRDEDMMLGEDGQIYEIGSTKVASRPRFVAKSLANKLALITQASRLGHSKLDFEIDTLSEDIANMPKGSKGSGGHPKDKMFNVQRRLKEAQLAKLIVKREDPTEQLNRLWMLALVHLRCNYQLCQIPILGMRFTHDLTIYRRELIIGLKPW